MTVRNLVRRFPLAAYFGLVYAVSVAALAVVGLPRPAAGGDRQAQVALVLFPVMVVAVGVVGVVLTAATDGRDGVARCGHACGAGGWARGGMWHC